VNELLIKILKVILTLIVFSAGEEDPELDSLYKQDTKESSHAI